MKSIGSSLQTAIDSTAQSGNGDGGPTGRVDLYKTNFPAPSHGINVVYWENQLEATGTPYLGAQIDADYVTPPSGVATVQALWEAYYDQRPLGLDPAQDQLVQYE